MSIAFHGTPIVPVPRNGRAARTICDSTIRPSEDKAIPVLHLRWYPRSFDRFHTVSSTVSSYRYPCTMNRACRRPVLTIGQWPRGVP